MNEIANRGAKRPDFQTFTLPPPKNDRLSAAAAECSPVLSHTGAQAEEAHVEKSLLQLMYEEIVALRKEVQSLRTESPDNLPDYYNLVPYIPTKSLRREIVQAVSQCTSLSVAAAIIKGLMSENDVWDKNTPSKAFCAEMVKYIPIKATRNSLYMIFYRML